MELQWGWGWTSGPIDSKTGMGLGTASAQTASACLAAMGDGSSWSPRTGSANHWKNSPTGLTCCLDVERNDKAEMTRHRKTEDCLIQTLQKISNSGAYQHSDVESTRSQLG